MPDPVILVDRPTPDYRGRIDPDAVRAFARATNDPNPACHDGSAVPLYYTTATVLVAQYELMNEVVFTPAITGWQNSVHGEHDVRFHQPVRAGVPLTWTARIHSAHQTRAGVLLTPLMAVVDERGDPVVEHLWSSMLIGGSIAHDEGPDLPDHTLTDEIRSRPLDTFEVPIDVDQGFRFAGASGDRPPHSVDADAARSEGFDGKILQGVCTLSMTSSPIVARHASGNPDRVRRAAGRLSRPTYPHRPLVVSTFDGGRTADGAARVVAYEARSGDDVTIRNGWLEIVG